MKKIWYSVFIQEYKFAENLGVTSKRLGTMKKIWYNVFIQEYKFAENLGVTPKRLGARKDITTVHTQTQTYTCMSVTSFYF
jgi:hypothetical protein